MVLLFIVPSLAKSSSREPQVTIHRPEKATWKRTRCGGPASENGVADIPSQWAREVSATSALKAYPRPQMVRGTGRNMSRMRDEGDPATWFNFNGLWEWEKAVSKAPPFGQKLKDTILVPFPAESCLSGVVPEDVSQFAERMWYRITFDYSPGTDKTLLHFGAVDWQADVFLNGRHLGNHTGGYDGFSFDITEHLEPSKNELIVYVYDPSNKGSQPNGKQDLEALKGPQEMSYAPSSGIWQTVWLEAVPAEYIKLIKIDQASMDEVTVTADVVHTALKQVEVTADANIANKELLHVLVLDGNKKVAEASGAYGAPISIKIHEPKLWSPTSPHLYDLKLTFKSDEIFSYFGLRTFVKENLDGLPTPMLNGNFTFMLGVLDQSYWPDGLYTAPTDEALESDIVKAKALGFNMVRLHQKVNPERWYYHADKLGLVVFQDMVQKFHHASKDTVPLFVQDLRAMIVGRGNHPCILQWNIFNEADCYHVFKREKKHNIQGIFKLVKEMDPTRPVDMGGGVAGVRVSDVLDVHSYPDPMDIRPNIHSYAMLGEFGGVGSFVPSKEWVLGKCHAYASLSSAAAFVQRYREMLHRVRDKLGCLSSSVYTQLVDVEAECNGFYNYDRSWKLNDADMQAVLDENMALVEHHKGPFTPVGLLHFGTLADAMNMQGALRTSLCFAHH